MAELERVIRRGGVYWVRSMDEWGGSSGALGRPAVVVSNDYGNDHGSYVNVAFCTTQIKPHNCNVNLSCTDKPSQVMCNHLAMVEKNRLGTKLGHVSEEELQQINETLALVLGLTLHKKDVDIEIENLNSRVAELEDELLDKRIEIAVHEKMYNKALEMAAGYMVTRDIQPPAQKAIAPKKARVPKIVQDEPEVDVELDRIADTPGKVNVNTATWQELSERTGMSTTLAHYISGYRKKNGNYGSLEDLLKVERFKQYHLDKFGDMLTV